MAPRYSLKNLLKYLQLNYATNDGKTFHCPYCGSQALSHIGRRMINCSACDWHGSSIDFICRTRECKKEDAEKHLVESIRTQGGNKIWLAEDVKRRITNDLAILAYARMHFAFYNHSSKPIAESCKKLGISKSTFYRVLSGDVRSVSVENWSQVVLAIKSSLDIPKFKKDLKKMKSYLAEKHEVDDGELVHRFRYAD